MIKKIFYWIFLILSYLNFGAVVIELFMAITVGLGEGGIMPIVTGLCGGIIFYYIASKLKPKTKEEYQEK